MTTLFRDVIDALVLILRGDPEVWFVTGVSLQVSVSALVLATIAGIPAGYVLARRRGRVPRIASWVVHTLTAVPTVAVGLGLYFLLSASGPFGWMHLLYTRAAMVVGQTLLALPIVAALTITAMRRLPVEIVESVTTLGLRGTRAMRVLLGEARETLVSAVLLAFSRVFTELGAAIIVGGNIRGHTRTLTTVIALENTKGNDALALALAIVLVTIALVVNGVAQARAILRKEGA